MFDPVFVLTYKNRPDNIIQRLLSNKISVDENRKIYFVCYDFDFKESNYDKYELPKNMEFLKIDFQNDFVKNGYERCVQAKRHFIINKAIEMGYHLCWLLDDDLLDAWKMIDLKKHKKEKIVLEEALQYMEKSVLYKDFSVASFPSSSGAMTFVRRVPSIVEHLFTCDNFYVNLDVMKRENLNFTYLKNHCEDAMIIIDSMKKGIKTFLLQGTYALNFSPMGNKNTLMENYTLMMYNLFKDYGRFVRYIDKGRTFGKNKTSYITIQIDKKRIAKNIFKIDDEAQIEMEKATNAEEWTNIIHKLTLKYNLKRKGI